MPRNIKTRSTISFEPMTYNQSLATLLFINSSRSRKSHLKFLIRSFCGFFKINFPEKCWNIWSQDGLLNSHFRSVVITVVEFRGTSDLEKEIRLKSKGKLLVLILK